MKYLIMLIIMLVSMTLSAATTENRVAENLIMNFEGFEKLAYTDEAQKSIGYGTSVTRAKEHGYQGGRITKAEAKRILKECIKEEEAYLKRRLTCWNKLPKITQGALISASYNSRGLIGPKLRAHLNAGRYSEACLEMAYGHKGEYYGLVRRRFKEAQHMAHGLKTGFKNLKTPLKGQFAKLKAQRK